MRIQIEVDVQDNIMGGETVTFYSEKGSAVWSMALTDKALRVKPKPTLQELAKEHKITMKGNEVHWNVGGQKVQMGIHGWPNKESLIKAIIAGLMLKEHWDKGE